jgi:hypothetical protein
MDHAPVFEQQMLADPVNRKFVPPGMDAETFLLFAGGMWRLSYVFSVWKRGEALGLTAGECAGLKAEMLLWLQGIPGFYAVYRAHTSELKAHNPDFLTFLVEDVYNEEFHKAHQVPTAA